MHVRFYSSLREWVPVRQSERDSRSDAVCRAIASSSLVGTTAMVIGAPAGEITRAWLERTAFSSGSTRNPRPSSPSTTAARSAGLFSPTPAVKLSRSSRPRRIEVRAEVVLEPMDVHLERQLSRLVARTPPLLQLAEVVDTGHAFEAGLLVQQRVDLRDSHPELVVQEGVQTRIDVA